MWGISIAQSHEWIDTTSNNFSIEGIFEIHDSVIAVSVNAIDDPLIDENNYRLDQIPLSLLNNSQAGFYIGKKESYSFGPNYITEACQYISELEAWMLLQVSFIDFGHNQYRLLLLDQSFNILETQLLDTLGYPATFTIACDAEKCHLMGFLLGPPQNVLLHARCDFNRSPRLSAIRVGQSQPEPGGWITGMYINKDDHLVTFSPNGITVLDTLLTIIDNFPFATISTYGHGDIKEHNQSTYTHGLSILPPYDGKKRILFQQYDSDFQIIRNDTLGWVGWDNYPFYIKSLDIRNDEIVVGGHLDGPFNGGEPFDHLKKFYVAKYDLDLTRIWYKEFGGDRAYWLAGLKLMQDGSTLVYGSVLDFSDEDRIGYILHISAEGDTITSVKIPSPPSDEILISNSGSGLLTVKNPKLLNGTLHLFTIDGKEVWQGRLIHDLHLFDIQNLPDGIYVYCLQQNQRMITSGKITISQ